LLDANAPLPNKSLFSGQDRFGHFLSLNQERVEDDGGPGGKAALSACRSVPLAHASETRASLVYALSMKRICVFCGSHQGARPEYRQAALGFAEVLAARRIALVYGGASVGLMGVIADQMLACGGEVVGVIPRMLVDSEVAHRKLTELREVNSMHERKALMAELADGFATLPGGFGTLEEFTEVVSWRLLGLHQKPCGLLNVGGYFNGLLDFLDYAVSQQFIKPLHRANILVEEYPAQLVDRLVENFAGSNGGWPARREQT
jgi:hypothetical protein